MDCVHEKLAEGYGFLQEGFGRYGYCEDCNHVASFEPESRRLAYPLPPIGSPRRSVLSGERTTNVPAVRVIEIMREYLVEDQS